MLCGAGRLPAQELKPAAVVLLPSYDAILAHVSFAGQLADTPNLSALLESSIVGATQGKGLNGLDKSKPLGAVILLDSAANGAPQWLAFAGVTDLKALLGSLPMAPPQDKGGGVWEVRGPKGPILATQHGGWAWLSSNADRLKAAPADPLELLGGLEKEYSTAIRLNVQNIPADIRKTFLAGIQASLENGLEPREGVEPSTYSKFRKATVEKQLKAIEAYSQDVDQVTLGEALDPQAKSLHFDLTLTALPGSKLAEKFAGQTAGQSSFAGFLIPDAAFNLNFSQKLAPEDIDRAVATLESCLTSVQAKIDKEPTFQDDATRTAAKDVAREVFDVFENTAKAGKLDGGAVLSLKPKAMAFAAGGFVQDADALDRAFHKLADLEKENPKFPKIEFDAETYQGVRFHHLSAPIKDEEAKNALGDNVDIYIGFGKQSAYLAFGKGSLDLVKSVIDRSAAAGASEGEAMPLPPVQVNISLASILQFGESVKPSPANGAILQTLSEFKGKDHIRFTARSIENGMSYRILAEQGVLKVAAQALKGHAMPGGAASAPDSPHGLK